MGYSRLTKRSLLNEILTQTKKIMGQLDDIKADLQAMNDAADGVQKDLDFIKAKLDAASGGLSSKETKEVADLVAVAKAKFQALDAETDSTDPAV